MTIYDVLEMIRVRIEALNPVPEEYLISRGNANGFEELVPRIVDRISQEVDELEFDVHYGHHFPDMDLVLNGVKYGLELKSRNNGAWDTNGNSVFESITDVAYEEMFILFGTHVKGIPRLKVKYKPYWQATTTINVTHSPRFKINMNSEESVFKSSEEYAKLREMTDKEKVSFLQSYLKQNTSGVKWFVPQEENALKPTNLNSMPQNVKSQMTAEVLILFPQDFIQLSANYNRSAEHLILNHFYYSSSFRDFFSAGGKWDYNGVPLPQIFKRISGNRKDIISILENANEDFQKLAYDSWIDVPVSVTKNNFKADYNAVIDYLGKQTFSKLLEEAQIKKLSDILE